MKRSRSALAAATAAAVALLAPRAARADEVGRSVSVAVAANLKPAFEEIARAFDAKSGVEVKATYGASGSFFAQIQNGAPFDLFLSADAEFPAKVAEAGLADGEPFTYAFGTLVVWVPNGSKLDLDGRGLAALADRSVQKLAIPNPQVAPYGRAAEAALKAAGVYDEVKGRFVMGQNVSQTAQFAQSGNAQAAFVPLSLALAPPLSQDGRHYRVPEHTYDRIRQDGVVLRGARDPQLARELAAFLSGPGRATLEKFGYVVPSK
ncbi:MAG TPA: molybdate ABC transporter substrate-binding protein [Anaeromyxobacteraceae bacterium]|nr:molybdate ABC transporter substrate-binding protein [Anaeromyxobacteraceae bacterium]